VKSEVTELCPLNGVYFIYMTLKDLALVLKKSLAPSQPSPLLKLKMFITNEHSSHQIYISGMFVLNCMHYKRVKRTLRHEYFISVTA
jgi:hypothetical protein